MLNAIRFNKIKDKNLDPRVLNFRLSVKMRRIIESSLKLENNPKEREKLQKMMELEEANKSLMSYDDLNVLHSLLLRINSDYNFFFYQLLDETSAIIPPSSSNKEYASRVSELKRKEANQIYHSMTKGLKIVASNQPRLNDNDWRQLKPIITALINSIIVIVASFFFIYKAVEYALPQKNISIQMLVAILGTCVIASAELYFFIKIM